MTNVRNSSSIIGLALFVILSFVGRFYLSGQASYVKSLGAESSAGSFIVAFQPVLYFLTLVFVLLVVLRTFQMRRFSSSGVLDRLNDIELLGSFAIVVVYVIAAVKLYIDVHSINVGRVQ